MSESTTEDTDIDGKRKGYIESAASTYKPRKLEQKDHHKPKASLGCRETRKHKVGRRVRSQEAHGAMVVRLRTAPTGS